jgi:hypothetical protein
MTLAEQQLCQRIQDEQGFLIVAAHQKHPVGRVLTHAFIPKKVRGIYSRAKLPAMRVIGYATPSEYKRQYDRYAPKNMGPVGIFHEYFIKVVAE